MGTYVVICSVVVDTCKVDGGVEVDVVLVVDEICGMEHFFGTVSVRSREKNFDAVICFVDPSNKCLSPQS